MWMRRSCDLCRCTSVVQSSQVCQSTMIDKNQVSMDAPLGMVLVTLEGKSVKWVDHVETLKWLQKCVDQKWADVLKANNWITHFCQCWSSPPPIRHFFCAIFWLKITWQPLNNCYTRPDLSPCDFCEGRSIKTDTTFLSHSWQHCKT